jgi:hypothetical protein
MKKPNHFQWLVTTVGALFVGALIVATGVLLRESKTGTPQLRWQNAVSPGDLSKGHEFLGNDCTACHTANMGDDSSKCIVCHADNKALFQQQNTAFHASINDCTGCHSEHQGGHTKLTRMDHNMLAKVALHNVAEEQSPQAQIGKQLEKWIKVHESKILFNDPHHRLSAREHALNCASCHSNQDVHRGLMGNDCAACHATVTWDIPEFVHPSVNSRNCSECHKAPPSHYMMHFKMVSAKVAQQRYAKVEQCFMCHQTNDWNDIKEIGWYKHH